MKEILGMDRKSILVAGSITAAFLVFFVFLFLPKAKAINSLRTNIKSMEEQIEITETMLGNLTNLGPVLVEMQQELTSFESKLPDRDNVSSVLKLLSNLAKQSSVEVIAIQPEKPTPLLDANQQPVLIDKNALEGIKIELRLRATYKAAAEYIKNIQESLDIFATINEMSIARGRGVDTERDIELVITVYVVGRS